MYTFATQLVSAHWLCLAVLAGSCTCVDVEEVASPWVQSKMAAEVPNAKKARTGDSDERDSAPIYPVSHHASEGALITVSLPTTPNNAKLAIFTAHNAGHGYLQGTAQ